MLNTMLVGHGRPDVGFLHGLFGRGKNWNQIARALAEQDHTSVLFDLPNHGRSHWTESFDYQALADEVAGEIELRMGSAAALTLVGHSLGGKVAMLVALAHPALVTRLVVVDIAPTESDQVFDSLPLVEAMRRLDLVRTSDRAAAEVALRADVPEAEVRQFLLQNLKHTRPAPGSPPDAPRWHWEVNLDLLGGSLAKIAAWPEVTGSYAGDVLWLRGALSRYVRPEHLAPMRDLFPRAELRTIAGAGHWVHADQPAAVTAAITEFLSRRSPR